MHNLFLYVLTVLVWGSTWLMIDFQLGTVAPEVSVVWRYAIAASLLLLWCLLRRRRLRFGLPAHLRFAGLGLLLFSFNYMATYSAQLYISSALNAVAFSAMMWMNVINARLFFGTRIEPRTWLGAGLGSGGLVILFWPALAGISGTRGILIGAGFSLGGALLASLGNMLSKHSQERGLPVMQSNAWGMTYGAAITALVAWRRGLDFEFDPSFAYVSSLLYLAVFGTIVAFGAYLRLVGRIGPHRAGYVVVMFPVVAVFMAVLFQGLVLNGRLLTGMTLVLAGNVAVLGLRRDHGAWRAWLLEARRAWLQPKRLVSARCSGPGSHQ